ncbi:MAG: efflux RND transporter permease subunit [Planctomycetaceae bacterium]|nr:MAG: efflux RND transporter permease subunit [Planctomycetaceae bacterium]
MIGSLIEAGLRMRWVVLAFAVVVAGAGVWAFRQQPVDAYPDISEQMVQVIAIYPGRAPEEVERLVTIPLENAMLGLPRVEVVRSRTIFGLSVVQMIFDESVEPYWARQRVQENLSGVELPEGVEFELGPLATAYGEVYRYELVSDGRYTPMELRTYNDWIVIRRLMRVPGVAEVANLGGLEREFAVVFNPAQLLRYDLTIDDIEDAIVNNNAAGGGSVVNRGDMSMVIRGRGLIETIEDLERTFIRSIRGIPIYLRDLAEVREDHTPQNGIFGKDDRDDGVSGIVLLRRGENPSEVLEGVQAAVAELNLTGLPEGVRVTPYYDRTQLVEVTLATVSHSVSLGITLVVLVLILFMGRPSMALLVAMTIPFSVLFALMMMYIIDIPIGLLSIGAIDFGIMVDGAVIMGESIARRLGASGARSPREVAKVIRETALDIHWPVFVSVASIMVAFLPLLSLTRIEGLLFRPMAITLLFALTGALLFALFVLPVLATLIFRRGYQEWTNPLLGLVYPIYDRILRWLLAARYLVATIAGCGLVLLTAFIGPRLGIEFLPYLDEGVIWVRANFPDGTRLQKTAEFGRVLRDIALEYDEIDFAVVQVGRNDDGTDPFPASRIEMMIGPKPASQWKDFRTKRELVETIGNRFRDQFPTTRFNFTQPIIDSVTEDANGTSANLAIELSGDEFDTLLELADQTVELLKRVPGNRDVSIEQEGPQPQLVIEPDRQRCARFGVPISSVMSLVNLAIGGEPIGMVTEEDRRFAIVAKLDERSRRSPVAIGQLAVYSESGVPVLLSQIADIRVVDGQTVIARQDGRRRVTVRCDIAGRDQGGFVAEAQQRFEEQMDLPSGYHVQWLGMFENLDRAQRHFALLIPITVGIIFVSMVAAFGSLRAAIILMLPVPFAVASGALALYLRGMHLNVSTGVGFATLFGIAMTDAVLMFKGVTGYRLSGWGLDDAIVRGRLDRLRPGLMTTLSSMLGLLPASLATDLGSDVQRPLATVIVWGLAGSTLFTLFITPVIYRLLVPPLKPISTT